MKIIKPIGGAGGRFTEYQGPLCLWNPVEVLNITSFTQERKLYLTLAIITTQGVIIPRVIIGGILWIFMVFWEWTVTQSGQELFL